MLEFGEFMKNIFLHGFGAVFLITRHFESKLVTIAICNLDDMDDKVNLSTITEEEFEFGITDATYEAMSYGILDFLAKAIEDREKKRKEAVMLID